MTLKILMIVKMNLNLKFKMKMKLKKIMKNLLKMNKYSLQILNQ